MSESLAATTAAGLWPGHCIVWLHAGRDHAASHEVPTNARRAPNASSPPHSDAHLLPAELAVGPQALVVRHFKDAHL